MGVVFPKTGAETECGVRDDANGLINRACVAVCRKTAG
jgi:hypothetical protein